MIHSKEIMIHSKKIMRAADEKLIINELVDWYYHFHGFVRSAIFVTVDDYNMDEHLQHS